MSCSFVLFGKPDSLYPGQPHTLYGTDYLHDPPGASMDALQSYHCMYIGSVYISRGYTVLPYMTTSRAQ